MSNYEYDWNKDRKPNYETVLAKFLKLKNTMIKTKSLVDRIDGRIGKTEKELNWIPN